MTLRRAHIAGIALVLGAGLALTTLAEGQRIDGDRPTRPPELIVSGGPDTSAMARRLERYDAERLVGIMRMVGIGEPGLPISIHLAAEEDSLASATPTWVAGYAVGSDARIVLFPGRTPAYPDDSFEDVLLHEVTHVLVYRAAHGRFVPRWFNEGLAMTAERVWGLEDRVRLTAGRLVGPSLGPADVDELFAGDRASVARAYAWSGAFVRYLLLRHGPEIGARMLREVATGTPFDTAFMTVTGRSLDRTVDDFGNETTLWNRWIPFLTSTVVLWIGITFLALYAFRRRQASRQAQRQAWDDMDPPEEPSATVH